MDIFDALAQPTRRGIVEILAQRGQLTATAISDKFKVTPAAISQHLKVLREADLVSMEKRAQQHIYRINPQKMLEFQKWVQKLTKVYDERFDRLDALLEIQKKKEFKFKRKI
jgi:DNA-binding transcriptional ArsR family regulator